MFIFQIALLDSPTALSMEEKLHQNEARVSLTIFQPFTLVPQTPVEIWYKLHLLTVYFLQTLYVGQNPKLQH